METKALIGSRIKELRAKKGITQEELSEKMEISPKYLSSIERGKENPTLATFIRMSDSLDVDLGDIFSFVQMEDPRKRRAIISGLLKDADDEQLKVALKVLLALVRGRVG